MKARARKVIPPRSRTSQYNRKGRRLFVFAVLMCGFAVVVLQLFHLQVFDAHEMGEKAKRQHLKVVSLDSSRGMITDTRGEALALNMDVPSIYAIPSSIENPAQTARKLARVVNITPRTLEKRLRGNRDFVWIKRKVTTKDAEKIKALSLKGIGMVMEERRFYPKGSLLSHVLGFAGIDSQGLEGIENGYETYLRGEVKQLVRHRDALGRTLAMDSLGHASVGHTITLTVDEVIQYIAEWALDSAVTKTQARGGAILVMDPKTGAILGWALRPTFNPNALHTASPKVWRNRAVTDPYEPGSTMKVVLAAAALEEGQVEPGTLIYAGDGQLHISGTVIHDHEKAGWLTFAQAVERSSNVAAVKTSLSLGKERLYRYLRAFGFGERTEIDLPGESVGLLKKPKHWGKRTLASMAIGQEIGVTPLQMVTAVSAVANNGWLMKPYVVREVRDTQGELVWQRMPEVRRRPISDRTAKTLTKLLVNAVKEGTGKRAAVPGYRVAGKTGTAQKIDPRTGTYSSTRHIASFLGFVPADSPRVAMLVLIDEPKGPGWGGLEAAPVFREVAQQILRHLGVPPQEEKAGRTFAAI